MSERKPDKRKFDRMAERIYINTESGIESEIKAYIAAALRRTDKAAEKRGYERGRKRKKAIEYTRPAHQIGIQMGASHD